MFVILEFLQMFSMAATVAKSVLPLVAAVRASSDPTVSNAGLDNTLKAIVAVQPIVAAVDAHAAAAVASGQPALSGADKLAVAQSIVQVAHDNLSAQGLVSQSFDTYWPLANAAISAVCAANKSAV
jgi:hypothetical protein